MPLRGSESVGYTQVSAAAAAIRRVGVLVADLAWPSEWLEVWGMPSLTFWMLQTVGAAGATVLPTFAISTVAGGPPPVLDWLPLNAGAVLVPGGATPLLWQFNRFPARYIRLTITRPAGQLTHVQYVLAACQ